ncbi:MAG: general secretion pathway protein GspB [Nitrospirota bacterium]|nr:general secretion pathway protein GspB [Nitrospirota bacterium]
MSFILDALKKAEQQRKKGVEQHMNTHPDPLPEKPGGKLRWPYLLLFALILNAGLVFWSLSPPRQAPPVDDSHQDDAMQAGPLVSGPVAQVSVPEPVQTVDKASPESKQGVTGTASPPLKAAENDSGRGPDSPGDNKAMMRMPAIPIAGPEKAERVENPPGTVGGKAPEKKVYDMDELPVSIRKSLPDLSVTAFIYSNDPRSRFVRIGDQIMYEGQTMDSGIRIERITPEGVILRYRKYRFFRKVF